MDKIWDLGPHTLRAQTLAALGFCAAMGCGQWDEGEWEETATKRKRSAPLGSSSSGWKMDRVGEASLPAARRYFGTGPLRLIQPNDRKHRCLSRKPVGMSGVEMEDLLRASAKGGLLVELGERCRLDLGESQWPQEV